MEEEVESSVYIPPFLPPPPPLFISSAFLTQDTAELQELAANSDRLISTLVSYLGNQPDESDELVEEKQIVTFDLLREVCTVGVTEKLPLPVSVNRLNSIHRSLKQGSPFSSHLAGRLAVQ